MPSNLKGRGVGMAMAAASLAPMVVPMVMKMFGGRRRKIRGRGLSSKIKGLLPRKLKFRDIFFPLNVWGRWQEAAEKYQNVMQ